MRIGINLLFLTDNTNSGVGKHTEALLHGFRKLNLLPSCYLFVRQCYYEKAKENYPEATIVLVKAKRISGFFLRHKKRHSNFTECLYLNRFVIGTIIRKLHIDVIFYPFNDSTIYYPRGISNILVIQSLYYLRYPEFYGKLHYQYAKHKHEYFFKHKVTIIAVSDSVKNDILANIKSSNDSTIHVIPDAILIDRCFTSFVPVDEPYILSIASHTYRKNLITLLRAFNLIKRRIPHQLIIIGKRNEMTQELHNYIKEYKLEDRVLCLDTIPDEHLNSLYRNASLLVAPSLHEGFGRVPIEAALLKTPVITSKSSAFLEVTLGLLNYYDPPTDHQALAMKIIEVLRDPPSIKVREQIASTYARIYGECTIADQYVSLIQSPEP